MLTQRELEILKLAATGLSNKKIGRMLDVSEQTVKNHMKNVMSKMKATDRTQAVVLALLLGFISLHEIQTLMTEFSGIL